jgi:magnesium-transporting ATPase (P-type)
LALSVFGLVSWLASSGGVGAPWALPSLAMLALMGLWALWALRRGKDPARVGLMSSIFDGLTFLLLLVVFHADATTFQTGWFVESLLTELCIVAVMRTHKSFFRSAPSPLLLWTSAGVALVTVASCYLPYAEFFAFAPLSPALMASLLAIVVVYVAASEVLKTRLGLIGPRSIPPARGRARRALWWRQNRVPR